MLKKSLKTASLSLLIMTWGMGNIFAQGDVPFRAQVLENGNFFLPLRTVPNVPQQFETELNNWLGLSSDFHFEKVNEITDFAGITHSSYLQYYKGTVISPSKIIVHQKNGKILSINGNIMKNPASPISFIQNITGRQAIDIAQKHFDLKKISNYATSSEVILNYKQKPCMAFEVSISGIDQKNAFKSYKVMIDAQSGKVIKSNSLIMHEDAEATVETYYSGTQTVITEKINDTTYALRDNTRNIFTYDVTGQSPNLMGAELYTDPNNIYNESTSWLAKNYIMSIVLNNVYDPALHTGIGISFTSFSGNILTSVVERNSDSVTLARNNDLGMEAAFSLPYASNNLFAPVDSGELYTGRFYKDSVGFDFATGGLVSKGIHTPSAAMFSIDASTLGTFEWSDANGNAGTYTIENSRHPALDAHWGITKTYDFYVDKFDYQSYDDAGGIIQNYYNGSMGTVNNAAAMVEQKAMVYGIGDGINFRPFVTLDVTAHEYTHMIMGNTANLEYTGESGALNEAFSDMMGCAIEKYAKPDSANWLIGDEVGITVPFLRSVSNPKAPADFTSPYAVPQPNTYNGTYWAPTGESDPDNGGVHINSGVANYWFYLLCEGGSGTNDNGDAYAVSPIGMDKATELAFATFTNYLTSTSDFNAAYSASIEACKDLYGEDAPELSSLIAAWHAVGIPHTTHVDELPQLEQAISIYPNPTHDWVNIQNQSNEIMNIKIIDISGKTVMSAQVKPGHQKIQLSHLPAGQYLFQFNNQNQDYSFKVIKQ